MLIVASISFIFSIYSLIFPSYPNVIFINVLLNTKLQKIIIFKKESYLSSSFEFHNSL